MAGRIIPFIVGGVVGAAAALLYAPRTGEETRAFVADKANETWGNMQSYGSTAQEQGQKIYEGAVARGQAAYQSVAETASAAYTRATSTAQDAISNVQEAVGNSKPFATTQNDELREKIEAARQRIAAQVAKNAAAAEDAVVETEAVVEQVEDASAEAEGGEEGKAAE